jgi:hypothetical protein
MKSSALRKALERDRKHAAGLKRFEAWVHVKDYDAIQQCVERLARQRRVKR